MLATDIVLVVPMRRNRILLWIERGLTAVGTCCLLWVAMSSICALEYQTTHAIDQPESRMSAASPSTSDSIGHLSIPRLGLSAVVAEGDDDRTLRVAVGHLPDTPFPWENGNTALAGHRDTFFRALRRIRLGDEIELATPHGTFRYQVTRQSVVDPTDLSVLEPSPMPVLTLITCYPFNFIGAAPQRFVVRAERKSTT